VKVDKEGKLSFKWKTKKVQTQLVGKHYLPNIQAAMTVALDLGLSKEMIIKALESFIPNTSFIHSRILESGAVCIDDGGTSNPKGFSAAIDLAKSLPQKRKVLISAGIVDLGEEAAHVHETLAKEAQGVFESVIYVGVDGFSQFEKVFSEHMITEREKVEKCIQLAEKDTVFLIEGKIPKWLEALLSK
jgi:UDP-N-acetylmuramyl pentapeptide synthase